MLPTTESAPLIFDLKDATGKPYTQVPDVSDFHYWQTHQCGATRSTHYVPIDKELHRRLLRKGRPATVYALKPFRR